MSCVHYTIDCGFRKRVILRNDLTLNIKRLREGFGKTQRIIEKIYFYIIYEGLIKSVLLNLLVSIGQKDTPTVNRQLGTRSLFPGGCRDLRHCLKGTGSRSRGTLTPACFGYHHYYRMVRSRVIAA